MRRFCLLVMIVLGLTGPALADPVTDGIYPAPQAPLSLASLPESARLISLTTADGLALQGIEIAARPGMPTLLVFHGNGSSAQDTVEWFMPALGLGYGLVAAEYRGYSGNPGKPNEAGLAADADAFLAEAQRLAGAGPVWIVGHSLGGGVALSLAERHPTALVATIGAFTNLKTMAPAVVRLFVPNAYRNDVVLTRIRTPYFLIHGLKDDVVPASQGQTLHGVAERSGLKGASFLLAEADHYPDGETVSRLLEAIRLGPSPGAVETAGLPQGVRIIPFGPDPPVQP